MTGAELSDQRDRIPGESRHGGLLTIDLGALAANWRRLRDLAGAAECAAVVKADAYGIGLEPAVRALARTGCTTFFVAHLSEGLRARAAGPEATIYVLNGLLPGTSEIYVEHGLRPVLGSREELVEWTALGRTTRQRPPAALHVDTGMNRLGLRPEEALALRTDSAFEGFAPALLMSHLVSAERPDDPLNTRQIKSFAAARAAFPDVPASLCNSSGIYLAQRPHYDLVRPGYALYGGNPTPGRPNPMRSVIRLEGCVIQSRWAEDGETTGYNAQWTARGRRRLATISVGYADGFPRAASATDLKRQSAMASGEAIVAGRRCPFAGRVSMDLIVVDVTDLPEGSAQRGDPVTLIGDDLTIEEVAERVGTIGYDILTGLGQRYARTYLGG